MTHVSTTIEDGTCRGPRLRRPLVRADGAGVIHELLDWLTGPGVHRTAPDHRATVMPQHAAAASHHCSMCSGAVDDIVGAGLAALCQLFTAQASLPVGGAAPG